MKSFSFDIEENTKVHILCTAGQRVINFGDQVFDNPGELERFLALQSFEHRMQFILKLLLLKKIGIKNELRYQPDGKPYLPEGPCVSISHSGTCVAVVLSDNTVGIDMQKKDDRVRTLRSKYLNDKDVLPFEDEDLFYHYAWAAKEAVYKACGKKGISLKNDIFLYERNGNAYAWCDSEGIFRLYFRESDGYYLAVAYKE